jgi:hypothetical protein
MTHPYDMMIVAVFESMRLSCVKYSRYPQGNVSLVDQMYDISLSRGGGCHVYEAGH